MRAQADHQRTQNFRADRTLLSGGMHMPRKTEAKAALGDFNRQKNADQIVLAMVPKSGPPSPDVSGGERLGDPKEDALQAKP